MVQLSELGLGGKTCSFMGAGLSPREVRTEYEDTQPEKCNLCADCTSEAGVVSLTTAGPFMFCGSFSFAQAELLSSFHPPTPAMGHIESLFLK